MVVLQQISGDILHGFDKRLKRRLLQPKPFDVALDNEEDLVFLVPTDNDLSIPQ